MWRFVGLVAAVVFLMGLVFYLKGPSDKLPTGDHGEGNDIGEPNVVKDPLGLRGLPKSVNPVPVSALSSLREPILVPGCTISPIAEQPIGARIDGKLQENLIKLGDRVSRGQPVGQMDETLPRLAVKVARVKAESDTAIQTATEKVKATRGLLDKEKALGQAAAKQDLEIKEYQYREALGELQKAIEDQIEARRVLAQKMHELELHRLHSDIDGTVSKVMKRDGSAVRAGETLFEVVNTDQLWVDALMARELAAGLRPGQRVRVEPEWVQAPQRELRFHTAPVTGLAVSPDQRLLASSSEDGRVVIWDWRAGRPLWIGRNKDRLVEFLAVAFSPVVDEVSAGVRQYRLLAGGADSSARLWTLQVDALGNINDKHVTMVELKADTGGHTGRVQALAFSPDGRYAATGGTDFQIILWNIESGKLLYKVKPGKGSGPAHRGFITALRIADTVEDKGQLRLPERNESRKVQTHLISVSTDKTIKRWLLGAEVAQQVGQVEGRSGDVAHLAISPDGTKALFDHADELRVVNLLDGSVEGIMFSPNGQFRNLAVVVPSPNPQYPDAHLTLTTTAQGRLQLRTMPTKPEAENFFRNGYVAGFRKNSLLALGALTQGLMPFSYSATGVNAVLSAQQPKAPPLPSVHIEPGFPAMAAPEMTPLIDVDVKKFEALAAVPELWSLGSYEVRHLKTGDGANVTCGAFAMVSDSAFPNGAIFTGGTDRIIRVWAAPDAKEQQDTVEAVLTFVGAQAETTTTPLVRIRAELDNPTDPRRRLMPNTKVNLTIFPEAVK